MAQTRSVAGGAPLDVLVGCEVTIGHLGEALLALEVKRRLNPHQFKTAEEMNRVSAETCAREGAAAILDQLIIHATERSEERLAAVRAYTKKREGADG